MGMSLPVTLIEGLKTREFRDPGDVLQWAEYETPPCFLRDDEAEFIVKQRTLPIMMFIKPDVFTGEHERFRVAYSPEVERLLGIPINTMWEERQRLERENTVLRTSEKNRAAEVTELQYRLFVYNHAPWWKKLWWALRGESI